MGDPDKSRSSVSSCCEKTVAGILKPRCEVKADQAGGACVPCRGIQYKASSKGEAVQFLRCRLGASSAKTIRYIIKYKASYKGEAVQFQRCRLGASSAISYM